MKSYRVGLAVLSGLLLGLAFPPISAGVFAVFAFVPLLVLLSSLERYGQALRYSYLSLFVFNLITVYWTGGFTHGRDVYLMLAGGMLLIGHPLFFCVPILGWMFFKKQFGINTSLVAFPFLWVAFEYCHSITQFAFPWLTIGNTQTYDLAILQFASFTGVFGISFWLLWLNVIITILVMKLSSGEWKPNTLPAIATALAIMMLYLLPKFYGNEVINRNVHTEKEKAIRIALIQPNIDPFDKWMGNEEKQLEILLQMTREIAPQQPDLIIWPETAVPFYLLHPANYTYFSAIKREIDRLGVPLLTGVPDMIYYRGKEAAPKSSKVSSNGERYDTFNSSLLLQPGSQNIQKYAKVILVPFGERVPYSEELSTLNAMQWNFGLGGWAFGRDTTIFTFNTKTGYDVKFANVICYESAYPGFVASFVKKGAEFLTIITNDSWWGNTSGTYQHKQFAILRATETRRWVAQCANGGISCVVDPFGHVIESTEMFTKASLVVEIHPETERTFYVEHGDWLAQLCVMIAVFFVGAAGSKKFYERVWRTQGDAKDEKSEVLK